MAGFKIGSTDFADVKVGSTDVAAIYQGTNQVWKRLVTPADIFNAGDVGFWNMPGLYDNWGVVSEGGKLNYVGDDSGTAGGAQMTNTNSVWQGFNITSNSAYWKWDSTSSTTASFTSAAITGLSGTSAFIMAVQNTPGNNTSVGSLAEMTGAIGVGRNGSTFRVDGVSVATGRGTGAWLFNSVNLASDGSWVAYEDNVQIATGSKTPVNYTNAIVRIRGGFSSYLTGPLFFINRDLTVAEREFLQTWNSTYF